MSNGIFIKGKLEFLKDVPVRVFEGKKTEPYQMLQISYLDESGFQLINVKDTLFITDKKFVGQNINCSVSFSSFNNNTYFKLLFVNIEK